MKSMILPPASRSLIAIAVLTLPLASAQEAPPKAPVAPAPATKEVADLQTEWLEVQGKIQRTEQQAAVQPRVIAERDKFASVLEKKMIENDPEVETKIEESKELVEKLQASPEISKPPGEQSPEFTKEVEELQSLEKELSAKRQKAVEETPEIRTMYESLQTAMVKEMEKIDPEIPQLLAKRDELAMRFQELQR